MVVKMVGIINSQVYTKGSGATLGVWKVGHGHPRILLGVIEIFIFFKAEKSKKSMFSKINNIKWYGI